MMTCSSKTVAILVTDPRFSKLYANLLYGQVFPENWKKMKKFDIQGVRVPSTPFPSVNVCYLRGFKRWHHLFTAARIRRRDVRQRSSDVILFLSNGSSLYVNVFNLMVSGRLCGQLVAIDVRPSQDHRDSYALQFGTNKPCTRNRNGGSFLKKFYILGDHTACNSILFRFHMFRSVK